LEKKNWYKYVVDVAGLWHCKIAEFGKAAIIRIPQMKTLEKNPQIATKCCKCSRAIAHCRTVEFRKAAIFRKPQLTTLEKTHKLVQSVVNVAWL
jgi:hypothetical protein